MLMNRRIKECHVIRCIDAGYETLKHLAGQRNTSNENHYPSDMILGLLLMTHQ
jgi:hypothetical protein